MKPIRNYENYQVSNKGEVVNMKTGKKLKYDENSTGYYRVTLSKNGKTKRFFVHRLVAETYLNPETEDEVVNHKDGNKQNNDVSNLEWVSQSENAKHAFRNNLRVAPNRLPQRTVEEIRQLKQKGLSRKAIALRLGLKESRVSDALYRYYQN